MSHKLVKCYNDHLSFSFFFTRKLETQMSFLPEKIEKHFLKVFPTVKVFNYSLLEKRRKVVMNLHLLA